MILRRQMWARWRDRTVEDLGRRGVAVDMLSVDVHLLNLAFVAAIAVTAGVGNIFVGRRARIVAVCSSGATHGAPVARAALGSRARGVGATIFAMGNAEVGIFGLVFDTVDGFDGVRNIGEVDERTVP